MAKPRLEHQDLILSNENKISPKLSYDYEHGFRWYNILITHGQRRCLINFYVKNMDGIWFSVSDILFHYDVTSYYNDLCLK